MGAYAWPKCIAVVFAIWVRGGYEVARSLSHLWQFVPISGSQGRPSSSPREHEEELVSHNAQIVGRSTVPRRGIADRCFAYRRESERAWP